MLEFSTLGHEEAADIPQFVHPRIPNEVMNRYGLVRRGFVEDEWDTPSQGHVGMERVLGMERGVIRTLGQRKKAFCGTLTDAVGSLWCDCGYHACGTNQMDRWKSLDVSPS